MKKELYARYNEEKKAEAWTKTAKTVKEYSDEMVDQWNKEIDALLTFAGLFSAILTAFNVESYQLLLPLASDQTNELLSQISAQLAGSPTQTRYRSAALETATLAPFRPPAFAVLLNILCFSSLVASLASASIGIIVKQWLKEYSVGLNGSSREIARRRQYRLNNLQK
ncbi:hypothetical protein C8Q74DRAFT_1194967 [Fomes fomentarius]|nr:hypothetical protein C8Q74DRAFT_1194967 [Fomes fomentarius]